MSATKEQVLIAALKVIAECKGNTLLGEHCNSETEEGKELEQQYEKGVNKGFDKCADVAIAILEAIKTKEARKPDCYKCEYRGTVPGSCHSSCKHPEAQGAVGFAYMLTGKSGSLHIEGDEHGMKSGWFYWPLNFDPIWLKNCDGFKPKGDKEKDEA